MARKPIEAEVKGLQTPRERIWRAIRRLRTDFTRLTLQDAARPLVQTGTMDTYINSLLAGGYIETTRPTARFQEQAYRLVRDQYDAPRVNTRGEPVVQGLATLAMWRCMQALKDFDHYDIARAASVGVVVVNAATAKTYVNVLKRAGYFRCTRESKPGTPARYRLIKNTGAHAPAITKRKCVFDRNLGEFTAEQTAQEVCDGLD